MRLTLFWCLFLISFKFFSQEIDQNTANYLAKNPEILQQINQTNNQSIFDKPKGSDKSIDSETNPLILSEKSKKFGFDYIKSIPTSISSTSDLPVPNSYQISLGDVLKVILTGGKNSSFTLEVGMDGSVLLPDIGAIDVFGEDIKQVRKKINQLVSLTYTATQAVVSLEQIKARKINIVGAVKNPGTYIVNPFSTITSSLSYSGGFEEYASLRSITLIRAGKKINFDLYDLLIYGKRDGDVNIQQGDTLLVNSTNNFVEISGEVNRPFIYEYKSSDTYKNLIYDFSLGPTNRANLNIIYAEKIENNELISFSPSLEESISIATIEMLKVLKNSQSRNLDIEIMGNGVEQNLLKLEDFSTLDEIVDTLTFSDDIYPFYAVLEQQSSLGLKKDKHSFSISDLNSYKGIAINKNPKIYFYSRQDIDDIQEQLLRKEQINVYDIEAHQSQTPKRNTQMIENQFPTTQSQHSEKNEINSNLNQSFQYVGEGIFFDIEESKYLTFEQTQVRQNEMDDYNSTIDSIIQSISKKSLKNFYYSEGKKVLPIEGAVSPKMLVDFFGISEDHLTENSVISLKNGDTKVSYTQRTDASQINAIYIPEIKSETTKVTIKGLVKSPGTYDLPVGTTLNNLYSIVDGFLDQADKDTVIFLRESIKENERKALDESKQLIIDSVFRSAGDAAISGTGSMNSSQLLPLINLATNIEPVGRLTGNLQEDSMLAKNLILEDGDVIEIIPKRSLVTITGQVLQPLTVTFDDSSDVEKYISMSGGFTKDADKKSIYVIRKNGTTVPLNNRLFNMETKILPGDTIVVPRDVERLSTLPLVRVATSVISDIAFAAASLNSLRN